MKLHSLDLNYTISRIIKQSRVVYLTNLIQTLEIRSKSGGDIVKSGKSPYFRSLAENGSAKPPFSYRGARSPVT